MASPARENASSSRNGEVARVAVVGATGYSGEELVRLLLRHPRVELTGITSRSNVGKTLAEVHPKFGSDPRSRVLRFVEARPPEVARLAEFAFLALPHGTAAEVAAPLLESGCRVIDLSADFRLREPGVYEDYYGHAHPAPALLGTSVYGLPEIYRSKLSSARLVASPGCYPTSILLPLIPLLRQGLVRSQGIIANSLSGVSGAGKKVDAEYLFCECNESVRAYGIPRHRHLSEIEQELSAAAGETVTMQFIPHLIPVNRGILSTLYTSPTRHFGSADALADVAREIGACFEAAYANEPFVRILSDQLPDTKNVVGTNVLEMGWRIDPRTGRLIIVSALDNLLKGASGQAVQSFNLLAGYPETTGLT